MFGGSSAATTCLSSGASARGGSALRKSLSDASAWARVRSSASARSRVSFVGGSARRASTAAHIFDASASRPLPPIHSGSATRRARSSSHAAVDARSSPAATSDAAAWSAPYDCDAG